MRGALVWGNTQDLMPMLQVCFTNEDLRSFFTKIGLKVKC